MFLHILVGFKGTLSTARHGTLARCAVDVFFWSWRFLNAIQPGKNWVEWLFAPGGSGEVHISREWWLKRFQMDEVRAGAGVRTVHSKTHGCVLGLGVDFSPCQEKMGPGAEGGALFGSARVEGQSRNFSRRSSSEAWCLLSQSLELSLDA